MVEMDQRANYDCEIVLGPGESMKVDKNTPVSAFLPKNPRRKKMIKSGEIAEVPKKVEPPIVNIGEDQFPQSVNCDRPFCIAGMLCHKDF